MAEVGSAASWDEIPDRTPSNARRNVDEPEVKAEVRASRVGARFCSRLRSWRPSVKKAGGGGDVSDGEGERLGKGKGRKEGQEGNGTNQRVATQYR